MYLAILAAAALPPFIPAQEDCPCSDTGSIGLTTTGSGGLPAEDCQEQPDTVPISCEVEVDITYNPASGTIDVPGGPNIIGVLLQRVELDREWGWCDVVEVTSCGMTECKLDAHPSGAQTWIAWERKVLREGDLSNDIFDLIGYGAAPIGQASYGEVSVSGEMVFVPACNTAAMSGLLGGGSGWKPPVGPGESHPWSGKWVDDPNADPPIDPETPPTGSNLNDPNMAFHQAYVLWCCPQPDTYPPGCPRIDAFVSLCFP